MKYKVTLLKEAPICPKCKIPIAIPREWSGITLLSEEKSHIVYCDKCKRYYKVEEK